MNKTSRKEMLVVSLWTALFGFSEPFFVPEYWNPPSLFNLAQRTGFDLESFIFSFAVGGLAAVVYEFFFRTKHIKMNSAQRHKSYHRFHFWILLSTPIIFLFFYLFSPLNPIYSVFISLMLGGFLTWYCRPDLKKKMLISAIIFTLIYFAYFWTLRLGYPGYVEAVWNFNNISGLLIFGVPIEELMFAFGLGFMWSSVYEHLNWLTLN